MVYEVLQKYLQICAKIKQTEREEKTSGKQGGGGASAKTRTWSPATWQLLPAESAGEWQRMASGKRQADEEAAESGTIWVLVARIEVELRNARGKRADCVLATCNNMQKDFRQFSLGSPLPHVRPSIALPLSTEMASTPTLAPASSFSDGHLALLLCCCSFAVVVLVDSCCSCCCCCCVAFGAIYCFGVSCFIRCQFFAGFFLFLALPSTHKIAHTQHF